MFTDNMQQQMRVETRQLGMAFDWRISCESPVTFQ